MEKQKEIINALLKTLFFVTAVVVILLVCPEEAQYQYQFEVGKPWGYGLLTADFDFPIYKDKIDLRKEREEVLNNKVLYFSQNADAKTEALRVLKADIAAMKEEEKSQPYRTKEWNEFLKKADEFQAYIAQEINSIYATGILTDDDINAANALSSNHIIILDNNNLGKKIEKERLYSTAKAKSQIKKNLPNGMHEDWFKGINFHSLLVPNLVYDEEMTEKVLDEEYKNVSATQGMVQSGERIIDKGEIVTETKYKILTSLKQESLQRNITSQEQFICTRLGQTLTICCVLGLFFAYSFIFRRRFFRSKRYFFISLLLITSYFVATALVVEYADDDLVYLIPYALVPILISTFYDTRTALFIHLTTMLLICFIISVPDKFILFQIPAGMVTIYVIRDVTERSQIITCALAVLLTYCTLYFAYGLMLEGDWLVSDYRMFIWFVINSLLLLFAYPFMYLIEKLCGFTTNVTLLELSNTNNELLRKLSEEAPGTFQHIMQVANLASDLTRKLDGNPLLARTGAMYHDIGKLTNPAFFTENQHGVNHHEKLTPQQSANIIIDHVKQGVDIAHQNSLPPCIIEFIETHHGKGMTKYFYNTECNAHPDKEVDPEPFTYPGPNPTTIEQGAVMICDAIEAASRSLTEYTDESISNLVDKIIGGILESHALDNTPLQLNQVELIKETLKEKLRNMYHTRVAYPELKNKK